MSEVPHKPETLRARAVLLGDRLTIDRARYTGVVSTAPFCFRDGDGFAVIFRYGAVVLIGLSPEAEEAVLAQYAGDAVQGAPVEEERVALEIRPGQDEGPTPGGTLLIRKR